MRWPGAISPVVVPYVERASRTTEFDASGVVVTEAIVGNADFFIVQVACGICLVNVNRGIVLRKNIIMDIEFKRGTITCGTADANSRASTSGVASCLV